MLGGSWVVSLVIVFMVLLELILGVGLLMMEIDGILLKCLSLGELWV